MKYIIYTSTASIYFRVDRLEAMLCGFRKSNLKHGITGMLIYSEGTFMQILEGKSETIDRLLKNIIKDKIHHSLMIWENKPLSVRLFADWSMSFKSVSNGQFGEMIGLAGKPSKTVMPLASYMVGLIAAPSLN
ncbi:MAG: BLUF domain-containing protein [Sphingobacteriaceae bacterium]|nr:MAG: BLUF domain-containing protein [Sphingobacteriaceae bacterium]